MRLGDVSESFSEYDSGRNREFREAYNEQWDLGWDPMEMGQLLQHMESFPRTQVRRAGGEG